MTKEYSVWTVVYNKDGSPNNEVLEGEFDNKEEALKRARAVNGEVRKYNAELSGYDLIEDQFRFLIKEDMVEKWMAENEYDDYEVFVNNAFDMNQIRWYEMEEQL